jgi:4'-phosphopantetheinyl transferase
MQLTGKKINSSPDAPELTSGHVHIWYIPLTVDPERLHDIQAILSDEERDRAGRFIHRTDCLHWTAARGSLRLILSKYTGQAPDALTFTRNEFGKPALEPAASSLQFNLSYSQEQAVLAISDRNPVGVDLQFMPASFDGSLVDWTASPHEIEWLTSIPPDSLRQHLLRLWVRKEALLKAAGSGLSIEPTTFSLPPGPAPLSMEFDDFHGKSRLWTLYDLSEYDPLISLAACGEGHIIVEKNWLVT